MTPINLLHHIKIRIFKVKIGRVPPLLLVLVSHYCSIKLYTILGIYA